MTSARSSSNRRILIWLAILAAVVLAPVWLPSFLPRSQREASRERRSVEGEAQLLIRGKRYLAKDRNDDGRADCLLRPGMNAFIGIEAWRAAGTKGCGHWYRNEMSEELRGVLDRLLIEKYAIDAGYLSPLDLDGDSHTDCAVSVFQPERTTRVASEAVGCPTEGSEQPRVMQEAEREAFDRILVIEREVARLTGQT